MGGKERSMRVTGAPQMTQNAFLKELDNSGKQLGRLGNCLLNKTFDLTVDGSQRRNRMLIVLFIALGIIFVFLAHPLEDWQTEISHLFAYLFVQDYATANPGTPGAFISFVLSGFLNSQTLRYLPVFVLPFVIGLQSAASYLADIFELEDIQVAREFIMQVALTGGHESIRIGGGEVAEKDRNSPIYLIGGPGKVTVELDTAALFEKPDGQPHVIPPTTKGKVTLEGFERFRQAIDLRDQYTDPLDVTSRSLDGVPVGSTDVRMVFSVARDKKQSSAESPYPFREKAIETLVYGQACRVVVGGPYPSECEPSWSDVIQSLIRSELGSFMSGRPLAEYLASIGMPEVAEARQREGEIAKIGNTVVSESDPLKPREIPDPPDFQPRSILSNLFSQFAEGFSEKASERGVQLRWIGVGTWRMPNKITNEVITGKHLEAWRLSRENLGRSSKGATDGLREESKLQQTIRLIQKIPLARYDQSPGSSHRDIVRDLLLGYREQLIESIELLVKSRRAVPPSLHKAIKHIETVLGIKHWVGPASPSSAPDASGPTTSAKPNVTGSQTDTGVPLSSPVSPDEQSLYDYLVQITGNDPKRANRLIEQESRKAPHADRMEWIQRAIERFWRDNH